MTRVFAGLVAATLTAALVAASADDPPRKLTPDERQQLDAKRGERNATGIKQYQAGNYPEAIKSFEEALAIARRLYPKDEFPDGHPNLGAAVNNLAGLLQIRGDLPRAEALFRESLEMSKRLFKGDHRDIAQGMNNLAGLLQAQGKLADAEALLRDAVAMYQRLAKGDDPDTATALHNLGYLLHERGKFAEAEAAYREALGMRQRHIKGDHPALAQSLNHLGFLLRTQGRLTEAEPLIREALGMRQRLFKGGHPDIATSLDSLATLLRAQGKLPAAERHARDALAVYRRLFPGDHRLVAQTINHLGMILNAQGKYAEAEQLYREKLEMTRRLFKGDHPDVAAAMNNLGGAFYAQGKAAEAEALYRDSLGMCRRLYTGDHPDLAGAMSNLAVVLKDQAGKVAEAEALVRQSIDMHRRVYTGDHPGVALGLNNLGYLLRVQGKWAEAEAVYTDALAMKRRLYDGDHGEVAVGLNNLAVAEQIHGKRAAAEAHYREALGMSRRLVQRFAAQQAEGEALTLLATFPLTRDAFLSFARQTEADPAAVYPEVWAGKAAVGRVYEHRQQAARAATDPRAAKVLAELADARRRRAELILAPRVEDPATRRKREEDIERLGAAIDELDRAARPLLPAIARAERLDRATPDDLRKLLPDAVAVVDFLRYTHFEHGKDGEKRTPRYLAFVVTRDKVAWIDLGPAGPIEDAVQRWRDAITGGKDVPAAIPTKVRELLWVTVREALPAGTRVVYVSPDLALCRVPWAALPGDKPGTVLLEDFAVAVVPHGTFLLDQLLPREPRTDPPTGALVVGGVDYETAPAAGRPASPDLPVKPGAKGWPALPGAVAEAAGVAGAAARTKLAVSALRAEKATVSAVLGELPKARYAHFATHGFFADPSFRSVFQLDPKHFEVGGRGERVGAGALSPLVMTGLVLAGANDPKAPGRGIVTGEALIDLNLSGLELVVLSACETGLGEVAGGEGTFGLQRAFHLAGAKNVVASLWKVPDQPTAALMALFYRNLWEKEMPPVEALRQAQLEVYRNPDRIAALAEGFRGKFDEVPGAPDVGIKAGADGKAHPRLWAAFTLSGPGR